MSPTRFRCRRPTAALLLGALVLLPACRVTVATDVQARWDGSGRLAVSLSLDEEARRALEELGIGSKIFSDEVPTTQTGSPPEAVPEPFADLESAGWSVETGANAVLVEHEFEDPDQLTALAGQISGDVQPPLFSELSLSVESGLFRSSMRLKAIVTPTVELVVGLAGLGLEAPPSPAELEAALGAPVTEVVHFVFSVSLPDVEQVTTDPADAASVGPDAWEVPVGSALEVEASSGAWTPAFWVAMVALWLAVLTAAALGVAEFRHRRRRGRGPGTRGTKLSQARSTLTP